MKLVPVLIAAVPALLVAGCTRLQPQAPASTGEAPGAGAPSEPTVTVAWGAFGDAGWTGPDCWPHPVKAWRGTPDGAAFAGGSDTSGTLALAGWALTADPAPIRLTLDVTGLAGATNGLCGVLLGLDHPFADPLSRLDAGRPAVLASINSQGAVQLQTITNAAQIAEAAAARPGAALALPPRISFRIYGRPLAANALLVLSCVDADSGEEFGRSSLWQLAPAATAGQVAVVARGTGAAFRATRLELQTARLTAIEAGDAGPILGAWFRYDGADLHMTAQLMPMPAGAATSARLQILKAFDWHTVAIGTRAPDDERLRFSAQGWPASYDIPYRIAYDIADTNGTTHTFYWGGTVPRVLMTRHELLVAVLPDAIPADVPARVHPRPSLWPFLDPRLPHLIAHAPDLVCFQSATGVPRLPQRQAPTQADYDWLLTYRDLLRDTPALGVDVPRTRHGRLYVGMLPTASAPEMTAADADWQRWRGVDVQVLLAPAAFPDIALRTAPDGAGAHVRTALASADCGLGFVAVNLLTGLHTWSRRLYADGPGGEVEMADGWPIAPPPYGTGAGIRNLTAFQLTGILDPVIQIVNERDGRLVHAQRFRGAVYLPRVIGDGPYTVRIGDPETGAPREFTGLTPLAPGASDTINVTFGTP